MGSSIANIIATAPVILSSILQPAAGIVQMVEVDTKTNNQIVEEVKEIEKIQTIDISEEKIIDPKEEKNLKILERWKKKQTSKWENLPEGKFTVNASAYTAAADECGKSDGITASGIKVQEKRTLACPAEFPFGAKIEIEGYGVYRCEDRGGAIKGNKIDIYMETKAEAFQFGRRNLTAWIVK